MTKKIIAFALVFFLIITSEVGVLANENLEIGKSTENIDISGLEIPSTKENPVENHISTYNTVQEYQFNEIDFDEFYFFQSNSNYVFQLFDQKLNLDGTFSFYFYERQPYQYAKDKWTLAMYVPDGYGSYTESSGWYNRFSSVNDGYSGLSVLNVPADYFSRFSGNEYLYFRYSIANRTVYFKILNPYNADWSLKTNNKWEYFDNGTRANGWKAINGLQYYFENQEMVSDWWLDKNTGAWYFFNGGVMQRSNLVINGQENIFDTYGVWKGVKIADGWKLQSNNKWKYYKNNVAVNGWQSIDGMQYYFENQEMVSDWWLDKNTGAWYFFNGGVMQRSNLVINGQLNIFDTHGVWKGIQE